MIFTGQDKGAGEQVPFGSPHMADALLQGFTMSPQVFHHQVFARQLEWRRRDLKFAEYKVSNSELLQPHLVLILKMVYSDVLLHVQEL